MGRPENKPKSAGSKAVSKNPFKAWREGRKERKRQLEEEAARAILNETAGTENAIIRELEQVDFDNSHLPRSVLEKKTDPSQRYCDLELWTKHLIYQLRNNTQPVKADVRELDKQLWKLAKLLRQSVEQGDAEAAETAKTGLAYGIKKIRLCIPDSQPEFLKDFMNLNVKYLEEWITLVNMSQVIDKTAENLRLQRAQVSADRAEALKVKKEMADRLDNDPKYRDAYAFMVKNDSEKDRLKWSPLERNIHETMVRNTLNRTVINLKEQLVTQTETSLEVKRNNQRLLSTKLYSVPVFVDPNLMNKFKESVDNFFEEMIKADAEIKDSLDRFEEVKGRIDQMNYLPGTTQAHELAKEEARTILKEIKADQEQEINGGGGTTQKDLDLLTRAQVEELKAIAQQEAALHEKQTVRQTERQLQYES